KDLTNQIRNIRLKLEMSRLDGKAPGSNGNGAAAAAVATETVEAPAEAAAAATAESPAPAGDAAATAPAPGQAGTDLLKNERKRVTAELKEVQGEDPLMQPVVNGQTVAEVISGWTGIPVGKMVSDEIMAVLNLHEKLAERVIGQNHALEAISQRIRTSRAGLTDPKRPI